MKFFTYNQLLSRKTEIIKVVSNLLSEASFYELPHDVMMEALDEKNVAEDVVVKVSPESYDVLKFWVIGMDVIPLDGKRSLIFVTWFSQTLSFFLFHTLVFLLIMI